MLSVKEYVHGAGERGRVCLIGGHHAFPGRPDAFAIDSARHVLELSRTIAAERVQTVLFLDDIAASEACSAIGCATPTTAAPRLQAAEAPRVTRWLAEHLQALEERLIAPGEPLWRDLAQELAPMLRDELGGRVPTLAQAALHCDAQLALDDWLPALETLTYVVDRASFRPLQLARALRRPLPGVLFERSMVNAASRMLHKLHKRDGHGLHVSTPGEGQKVYWVQGEDGRRIELRHEENTGETTRAANKCSAILSQLFYHCAKSASGGGGDGGPLTIIYIIPCYDRSRLADGIWAFGQLYGDTQRWFGASEVRVVSAWYCTPERDQLLCDEWTFAAAAGARQATLRLVDEPRRPRSAGVAASAQPIYVDNNATTAVDPVVLAELLPFLTSAYGNASSSHGFGWDAEAAVAEAARSVAALIGAEPDEIFFTSGATEANNWIVNASVTAAPTPIVTAATEHKSVLETVTAAEHAGRPVHWLPVDGEGQVQLQALEALELPPGTLVTLMAVNNEVHSLLDLERAGQICAAKQAIFHTDAAQALGAVALDVRRMRIGAMSLSAHKIYGPKGVGALFIARELQPSLRPYIVGGGQQRNMRAGTVPTALVVGMGKACELARARASEPERLERLSRQFLELLGSRQVRYRLIGPQALARRRPGSLCLAIEGLDGTKLCEWMPEVALSQGSACNSKGVGSHVLRALGIELAEAKTVIRLSFGRFNREADVRYVADRIAGLVRDRQAPQWTAERQVAV